jgi:hypothetical protein
MKISYADRFLSCFFNFSSGKITGYTLKIGHNHFLLLSYMIAVYVNMIACTKTICTLKKFSIIIVTSNVVGVLEGRDYMSWLTSATCKEVTPSLTASCG